MSFRSRAITCRDLASPQAPLELRRSEMRWRLQLDHQVWGLLWVQGEIGYRVNWGFHADQVPADGSDFFRGFWGKQPHAMRNDLGNPVYGQISIQLRTP